jgi:hypothetical protein
VKKQIDSQSHNAMQVVSTDGCLNKKKYTLAQVGRFLPDPTHCREHCKEQLNHDQQ